MDKKSTFLKYSLHLAVLTGLIWAAVKYVNGSKVLQALQSFNFHFLPFMLALSLAFFLLSAWRFAILMRPFAKTLSNLTLHKAYVSGQAVTLLPGGIAARAGLMKQVGVPIAESSVPVAVHSGWDQALYLASALIAALWFPQARTPVFIIVGILSVIVLLLTVPPLRHWQAARAENIVVRLNRKEQWQHFLKAIPQTFSKKIVLSCFLITIVTLALSIVILDLTMRGFDQAITFPSLFLAVVLPTMLGRLLPIPGGVGVTEATMVGFMTSLAELDTEQTIAAVAIFRIVTIVFPAVLGALVYFFFWKGEDELRDLQTEIQTSLEVDRVGSADLK